MNFHSGHVAVLCFLVGCGAAAAVPAGKVTQTEAAIRTASEVGAPSVPRAALHLKMAQDQLQMSKSLMAEAANEEASLVLDRARVDAELAIELATEASLRALAAESVEKVNKLRAHNE